MRIALILSVLFVCTSCTLSNFDIPVAPENASKAVVFDIDGTLTPGVASIFTARADAATAVRLYADEGYKIIYLSARVRLLQSGIPDWLKRNDFPEGSIQVPQSGDEAKDHALFKTQKMKAFQEKGWQIFAAYGDSSTDFEAYVAAGLNKQQIFALQRSGEDACKPGVWQKCLTGWTEHLDTIQANAR